MLLTAMSKHLLEEARLGMEREELDSAGTVSINLELNLLGMFELGHVSSGGGDWRLLLGTGGNSESSSSTSEDEEGEGFDSMISKSSTYYEK